MAYIDVFNGDADGICSLVQLRLAEPRNSELVTGIMREISLLRKVEPSVGDWVTALDISLQKNQSDLLGISYSGAEVFYADHHNSGEIIDYPALQTYIDTFSLTCTALIVDRFLHGSFHLWTITATFVDNLSKVKWRISWRWNRGLAMMRL